MVEGPPQPEVENPILSYDQFVCRSTDGWPRYNNFILFFKGDPDHISRTYFQQLCQEKPDLILKIILFFQKLAVLERNEKMAKLPEIEQKMHEAYQFMRVAGASDNELFV